MVSQLTENPPEVFRVLIIGTTSAPSALNYFEKPINVVWESVVAVNYGLATLGGGSNRSMVVGSLQKVHVSSEKATGL